MKIMIFTYKMVHRYNYKCQNAGITTLPPIPISYLEVTLHTMFCDNVFVRAPAIWSLVLSEKILIRPFKHMFTGVLITH